MRMMAVMITTMLIVKRKVINEEFMKMVIGDCDTQG